MDGEGGIMRKEKEWNKKGYT